MRSTSTPPSSPRRFFQVSISGWETVVEDGVEYIRAALLRCGHRLPYKRRRPAPSGRTTAPCVVCGAGTRTPYERRRAVEWRVLAIRRAARTPDGLDQLEGLVSSVVELLAVPSTSPQAQVLREAIDQHLRAAQLREEDEAPLRSRRVR